MIMHWLNKKSPATVAPFEPFTLILLDIRGRATKVDVFIRFFCGRLAAKKRFRQLHRSDYRPAADDSSAFELLSRAYLLETLTVFHSSSDHT